MKYQQTPKNTKCPICGCDHGQTLWCTDSNQSAQHFILKERFPERFLELVSHIENLWGQDTCEIVQCDNCEFCYSDPYISGDEKFYNIAYVRSAYPSWKWEFQLTYDILKNTASLSSKFLEIGSGKGAFVKKIADTIISKKNILCTEFSDYWREKIKNHGLKCLNEDVRSFSVTTSQNSLDIICMFQVLEHMDNLDILFQKFNRLLKKGGSLFLSVPNLKRIKFNELHDALLDMPPNHIGRWNEKSFKEIGKRHCFYIADYKLEKFNFISMTKQFILYRLMRKSQQCGSLENKLLQTKNKYLRRIMQAIGFALNIIPAIPALTKMNSELGGSQWVHFIKKRDESGLSLK